MTVYVDEAIWKTGPRGRKTYAHLAADSLEELHEFAARIGVKRHFFHNGKWPHYDITAEQRPAAVAAGAAEVGSKELVLILRGLK